MGARSKDRGPYLELRACEDRAHSAHPLGPVDDTAVGDADPGSQGCTVHNRGEETPGESGGTFSESVGGGTGRRWRQVTGGGGAQIMRAESGS